MEATESVPQFLNACVNPSLGVTAILTPSTAISIFLAGGQEKRKHGSPVQQCSAARLITNCTLLT